MSDLEITYNSFRDRIFKVRDKNIIFDLGYNALIIFSAALVLALILLLLNDIFSFSSAARKFIFFGFVSITFASLIMLIYKFIYFKFKQEEAKQINDYAVSIGNYFPDIKDNLLNTLQLYNYTVSNKTIFSNDLIRSSIIDFERKTNQHDFSRSVKPDGIKKSFSFFVLTTVIFLSLFIIFPNVFQSSAYSYLNYNYTFIDNTLGIAFEVTPGNIEISKGEKVEISSRVLFNDPNYRTDKINLFLEQVSADGVILQSDKEELNAIGSNEFRKSLENINSDHRYYFEYKGIKSNSYNIKVSSRPLIKSVNVTVFPPAYTKMPSRVIEGNDITVIAGTQIVIDAETSDGVERSSVLFQESTPVNMVISGNQSKAIFPARNGSFRISLSKTSGDKELTNINSPQYSIKVIPDEYPRINIVEPSASMEIINTKNILIRSQIYDDFGFSKMQLGYRLSKTNYGASDKDFKFVNVPVNNLDATGLEVPYIWELSGIKLGTDDEVEYFIEIYDNDIITGPKFTRSDIYKLVMPSLEALLNKTEKTNEEVQNDMNNALEEAMEIESELKEFEQQLKNDPEELGLNDPAQNQKMQNKIENLKNKLSTTQQKLSDLVNELQNNNQISEETLEKFMELQQMFSQIDSKELREAMKKLQEALKNMNKEMLAEAMKNFKFDEEAFKKAIDKTKELLEKIMNEQKFGELTQKLDNITKEQEQLKKETSQTNQEDQKKLNENSQKQDQIKSDYEKFSEQLKKLRENMKSSEQKLSKEMQKLLEQMMKKNLEKKMEQSSQDLKQSNKSQSEKQQENISQDLQDLNQQMQDMLADFLEQQNDPLAEKMQEFLEKLQQMSDKQGDLKNKSEGLDKDKDKNEFKNQSGEQQKLSNDLSNTIEDMMSMGQQMGMTPMMAKNLGDAFNEMNNAVNDLNNKEGISANQHQGKAKENLDKAIEKMQQMCKNGNKPGKGSSLSQLLQGLEQLIQQQMNLNNKMNGMGMNGNQGKLSQEQMAQMQKLALEQQTIQKNLQQLNEEFKKQEDVDGKKMLGDLEQIRKDMMEMIKDMQSGNINPETKKRQNKILSRLLDFQLSQREKDFEKKRESRPGRNFVRQSPPEIIISKPTVINGINQDILEIYKESYSEDYELLIQKYMQLIKNGNK